MAPNQRRSATYGSSKQRRDEDYHFLLGVLAALDLVLVGHDQPVIAAEIIRASGPKELMRAARRSGYPFMRQLNKVYREESLL